VKCRITLWLQEAGNDPGIYCIVMGEGQTGEEETAKDKITTEYQGFGEDRGISPYM
jgi:hypothetical protein